MGSHMNNKKDVPLLIGRPQRGSHVPSTVLGGTTARVGRPIGATPHVRGRFGSAWLANLQAARKKQPPGSPPDALVSHWIVEAPFADPICHSYAIILAHLRQLPNKPPATHYTPDATHEICLHAIDTRADREAMLTGPVNPNAWLTPANYASQFKARDDDEAHRRLADAVVLICGGRLNPSADWQHAWVQLFGDCMLASPGRSKEDVVPQNLMDEGESEK